MEKTLTAILIGAGNRGMGYTDIMSQLGEKYRVVAVAEPIDSRCNYIKEKHHLPDNMCFTDYKPLLALGKIADFAIISTMDQLHFEPAMMAISLKYDLLLEKPVSNDPEECLKIALHAEEMGVNVLVCHVLRYSSLFITLKKLILDGAIGDIVSINHEECVGNVHQSHSFVRGNWGNSGRSSCMLLQKSCHDMDILQWLIGKKCKKVQSFGSLTYFKRENAPEGSPERCIDGCPVAGTCPYNAVKLYLDDKKNDWFRSTCARQVDPTDEQVEHALRTTQYGKCVFKCDNDVVDHQTVNMLFEGDVTVTFTMNAFNKGGRFIHIMGTKGEIRAAIDGKTPITIFDFESRKIREQELITSDGINGGHGGGDYGIISTLYDYLCGTYDGFSVSGIKTSVDNHLIVFAAEESRATDRVIDLEEFEAGLKNKV
ncbi:MAG: Gfo/Idh/MocA family oxidoreductase [Lachnospiraceae bacterium]|nr:Gfo/Idh/MocA family oxidoreductase [Lachnospiraceae bacterium]